MSERKDDHRGIDHTERSKPRWRTETVMPRNFEEKPALPVSKFEVDFDPKKANLSDYVRRALAGETLHFDP